MFWQILKLASQTGVISHLLVRPDITHSSISHLPSTPPAPPRKRVVAPTTRSPDVEEPAKTSSRPGCQIADACILAYGYLEELSMGTGGFGVLRLGRERLGEAAEVAERIGKREMADQIREIAEKMPEVHTSESAAELAEEMRPIKERAWRLGRACGLAHK